MGTELFHEDRTEMDGRRTDTAKLMVALGNYANAPKMRGTVFFLPIRLYEVPVTNLFYIKF